MLWLPVSLHEEPCPVKISGNACELCVRGSSGICLCMCSRPWCYCGLQVDIQTLSVCVCVWQGCYIHRVSLGVSVNMLFFQQTATAQQQSSHVSTIAPRSGGAFLGRGSVMVMLTAVTPLMNTRTAHEDLAQKMSLLVVMACASETHTGL